jgi:flagellar biosynthetic protein FliR
MELYISQFLLFLMLFARVTALIVVAPVIGHQSVPVQMKVALGMFFAFVLYPLAATKAPVIATEFLPLVLALVQEVVVGVLIGFATGLLFAGVRYAGELISLDTNLSAAMMFDPENNSQASLISEFLYLAMLMVFLLLNGHHFVLEALYVSYSAIPIGGLVWSGAAAAAMIKLSAMVFIVAVKLAAPIIVAMFLLNVALSILSRVMPQMNMFALVFPAKIGVGLFAVMAAAPLMVFTFRKLLAGFEENILELIKAL